MCDGHCQTHFSRNFFFVWQPLVHSVHALDSERAVLSRKMAQGLLPTSPRRIRGMALPEGISPPSLAVAASSRSCAFSGFTHLHWVKWKVKGLSCFLPPSFLAEPSTGKSLIPDTGAGCLLQRQNFGEAYHEPEFATVLNMCKSPPLCTTDTQSDSTAAVKRFSHGGSVGAPANDFVQFLVMAVRLPEP